MSGTELAQGTTLLYAALIAGAIGVVIIGGIVVALRAAFSRKPDFSDASAIPERVMALTYEPLGLDRPARPMPADFPVYGLTDEERARLVASFADNIVVDGEVTGFDVGGPVSVNGTVTRDDGREFGLTVQARPNDLGAVFVEAWTVTAGSSSGPMVMEITHALETTVAEPRWPAQFADVLWAALHRLGNV